MHKIKQFDPTSPRKVFKMFLFIAFISIACAAVWIMAPSKIEPIELILVKSGCYQMGATLTYVDQQNYNNEPVKEVCLGDFYLGKYEVTQRQWKQVMGFLSDTPNNSTTELSFIGIYKQLKKWLGNPSYFDNCGDECPVENVSWVQIKEFIHKLNMRTGQNYRMPTEAEWEYAARSGGKKERWAGTSKTEDLEHYAWYEKNSGGKNHPVGKKKPNDLGFYDMAGNVFEWVQYSGEDFDSGSTAGIRGGSTISSAEDCTSIKRHFCGQDLRYANIGFRLAKSP